MSESATEAETYLAELEEAEALAAGLLDGSDAGARSGEAGGDGEGLGGQAGAALRHMRKTLKRHHDAMGRVRVEVEAQVRAELAAERKSEASFRSLGVPDGPARALFEGVDATDRAAMAARAAELAQGGITWGGPPPPPPVPVADPIETATMAMMAAQTGAGVPEPWDERMRRMAADPGAFSEADRQAVLNQFNQAVDRAAQPSSGANG